MLEKLFICIGAQKAGTTWLHSVLKKDDRLSFNPFIKETHYFDAVHRESPHLSRWRAHHFVRLCKMHPEEMENLVASTLQSEMGVKSHRTMSVKPVWKRRFRLLTEKANDDWYSRLLHLRPNQKLSVDITPDYAVIGKEGFEHIGRVANEVKLLFILRNPVERAWSGLLQGKKRRPGGVKAFIENGLNDREKIIHQCTEGLNVGARNNYLKTMVDIENAGMKENLLVKFYDDITEDPIRFIDSIYSFIGLENQELLADKEYVGSLKKVVHQTTQKTEAPDWFVEAMKKYYRPMLRELEEKHEITLPKEWKQ